MGGRQRPPRGLEAAEEVSEGAPVPVEPPSEETREALKLRRELRGEGRRGESAVPDDFRRDTLADLGLGPPVVPEAEVGMRVHVDKARSDEQPPSRETGGGLLPAEVADGGDPVAPKPGGRGNRRGAPA